MKTRRQWIYQIREQLQSDNADARLSNRMIAQRLEILLSLLIRRDSDSRKTWRQTALFRPDTLAFRTLGEIRSRSVSPIPEVYYSSLNQPFLQLSDPNTGMVYLPSTPQQQGTRMGAYFWFEGAYLVLAQPGITRLTGRFFEKPRKTSPCQSELDVLLPVPDHLEEPLLTSVLQELLKAPASLPPDTYPNANELEKQGPA